MSLHIALFFTRGVSLGMWDAVGMLEREIALYQRLMSNGFRVSFVTYGNASDLEYEKRIGGIRILCNDQGLPLEQYEQSICSLHRTALADCHVIKTNQSYGAKAALAAAVKFKKPLVARCGYMWSFNASRENGYYSPQATEARDIEQAAFSAAARVVVTTEAMRSDVISRIPEAAQRVSVIPIYVDTDVFRPTGGVRQPRTLLFVGRIASEKNLQALLEAIVPLECRLTLIGEGKLKSQLRLMFPSLEGKVTWAGSVPNSRLPEYLNRAALFVLPSLYEGHPKVLLEAMACAVPVIGADSPGIRPLIRHRETGYLCGTDASSLRQAISDLCNDSVLRDNLGTNAREYVVANFSVDRIVEMETAMLQEVIRTG